MARKAKIDNAKKKRFERQETKRRQDIRFKRRYYLIVCEGVKTEVNYFRGLQKELPPHAIELIDLTIKGAGLNTLGVVEEALSIKTTIEQQPGRVIDEVWAVFDRDSFPAAHFNNAIGRGNSLNVQCAWTNEAFELWFLLHFQNFEHAMRRTDYQRLLEREITQRIEKPYTYQKNSESMFALLQQHGSIEQAIQRAKMLESQFTDRTDYANHNPCTRVYALVEKLLFPK